MPLTWPENFSALWKAMSASRTIPSRSPTITPHIETVCANNTRICPTNSDKRASSPLYPGSMASNSISVSVNLNAAPDTAESNYLPLQNLCTSASTSESKYEQADLPLFPETDYSLAVQRSREVPELIRPHALAKDDDQQDRQFGEELVDQQGSYLYGRWWHLWVERFPWNATPAEQKQYAQTISPDLPFASRAIQETTNFLRSTEIREVISTGHWFRSEVAFSHPIAGTRWMEGVIDLVVGTRSKEIWIIDWKTNQKQPGQLDAQLSRSLRDKYVPQLESYRSVLEQGFHRRVSRLLIYSTFLARFV